MALAADSIRHLTRASIGARTFQGLLFWWALVQNIMAACADAGVASPRVRLWLIVGGLLAGATLGTYYRRRFGQVEPVRPSPSRRPFENVRYGVLGATALVVCTTAGMAVVFRLGTAAGLRPIEPVDFWFLILSGSLAMSLARSRGEHLGWLVPVVASLVLLATLVVPALGPYRIVGHAGMAAALMVTAVQLHLFLARGLRDAHV